MFHLEQVAQQVLTLDSLPFPIYIHNCRGFEFGSDGRQGHALTSEQILPGAAT